MVVDLVDVIRLHPLVDAHELFELLVIRRVGRGERAGGDGNQGERADERERRKKLTDHFHQSRPRAGRRTRLAAFGWRLTGFEMNLR